MKAMLDAGWSPPAPTVRRSGYRPTAPPSSGLPSSQGCLITWAIDPCPRPGYWSQRLQKLLGQCRSTFAVRLAGNAARYITASCN